MIPDERGQTHVLGFTLAFALLIVVFTMWQSQVVPHQNEQAEFEHATEMEGQMTELRDEMKRVSRFGTTGSYTMQLAPEYPTRSVTLNGPPPSGRVAVTENLSATYRHFSVPKHGYAPYDNRTYTVGNIRYTPRYNVYDAGVTDGIEHGVVFAEHPNGHTRVISGENIVEDRTINILNVRGEYDASGRFAALEMESPVHSTEYIPLEADSGTNVELDTTMTEDAWAEILEDELVANGGSVESYDVTDGTVAIDLEEDETFQVHNTMVSFGDEPVNTTTERKYIAKAGQQNVTAVGASMYQFKVVVYDEFGYPVSGENVTVTSCTESLFRDDHSCSDVEQVVYTDANGVATVMYGTESLESLLGEDLQFHIQDNDRDSHRVYFRADGILDPIFDLIDDDDDDDDDDCEWSLLC